MVPIILPRSYLAIYNFGFAQSQSLPKLSEGVVGMIELGIVLRGDGREERLKGRVIGFSSRLNTILVPVPENLVYIDDVDPETLGMLEESVKLTAADFLAALETDEIGFAADNVRVTFDENGDLAVIDRYYVPWQ